MQNTPILKNSVTLDSLPIYDDLMLDWKLMGANEFVVQVDLPGKLIAPIGSQIYYKGQPYVINTEPSVGKAGNHKFRYNIVFESAPLYRLFDKKLRHLNNRTFQYYGKPVRFAELIVSCINEIDPGWTVGPCEDMDEKTINFSGHTCRSAMDIVAETFKIEWDVTVKVISFLKQVGTTTPYVFKYGQGNGLYSLSYQYQNDKNIITRAYGYGSTRNLPSGYRGGATQLMFNEGYLEKNVYEADGVTLKYATKEGDYENEDIYPEVIGTVSDAPAWVQDSAVFYIIDTSLDFNLNDYKSVDIPKLSFKTGELQGQNFEIIDFNNTTKTYKLKVFKDSNNNTLPSTVFKAQPGDTYTLFDMPLPNEKVIAAEAKLKAATQEWLNTNSVPQVLYSLELDPLYARDNNIMLKPGDRVRIQDTDLGIDELIRVVKVNYPYNFPEVITKSTKIVVEIANFVPYTITERVLSDVIDTKHEVKTAISDSNFQKRVLEQVEALTGVRYLPAGTAIVDPDRGKVSANLIDADFIVTRNLITGKVKITALNNNIVFEDDEERAIMMMDDTGSLDGISMSLTPPQTSPSGKPDPDYLFSKVINNILQYFYAIRGPGLRVGLSPLNSNGFSSIGRKKIYTNGVFEAAYKDQGISMDKDGFRANGYRTMSGHVRIQDQGNNVYSAIRIQNGLVVNFISNLLPGDYIPLTTDATNAIPSNDTNDTGYDPTSNIPGDGGTVDPPVEEPVDPPVDPPIEQPGTLTTRSYPYYMGWVKKEKSVVNSQYLSMFDQDRYVSWIGSENKLKFGTLRNGLDLNWYWEEADHFMAFAKARNLPVHLHGPLWYNDFPSGMEALIGTPDAFETAKAIVYNHFDTLFKRYPGQFVSVDAVNEQVIGDGTEIQTGWFRLFGTQMHEVAIGAIQAASSTVLKFLTDFDFETGNMNRSNTTIAIINRLAAQGLIVDGIGFQMHTILGQDIDVIRERFRLWDSMNLKVAMTELDVKTNTGGRGILYTPEIETELAHFYVDLFDAYEKGLRPQNRVGALWFSATDREKENIMNNPIKLHHPVLFDDLFQPKLAYHKLVARLNRPVEILEIFQDFELGNISSNDFIGSETGGTFPAIWRMNSSDTAAKAEVTYQGLSMAQTNVNVFNHVIVTGSSPNFKASTRAGLVFDFDVRVMHFVFRFVDENNMFSIQAYKSGSTDVWRLVKRKNGTDQVLHTSSLKPKWGDVPSVSCLNSDISYSINDEVISTISDTDFSDSRTVGFKFKGHFDHDKFSSFKYLKYNPI